MPLVALCVVTPESAEFIVQRTEISQILFIILKNLHFEWEAIDGYTKILNRHVLKPQGTIFLCFLPEMNMCFTYLHCTIRVHHSGERSCIPAYATTHFSDMFLTPV